VQKFTRPITREVELAGERLAFTLNEQGVAIRPVGSRKPPWEISWGALLIHLAGHAGTPSHAPTNDHIAAAIEALRKGDGAKPAPHATHPEALQPAPGAETM